MQSNKQNIAHFHILAFIYSYDLNYMIALYLNTNIDLLTCFTDKMNKLLDRMIIKRKA